MAPEEFDPDPFLFARLMGVTVTRTDPECVEAELMDREDLCASGKILHGGAIMAVADSLGALVTLAGLPAEARGTATIESETSFFRPAPPGARLTGRSTPLHLGRTTHALPTTIDSEAGKRIAVVMRMQIVLSSQTAVPLHAGHPDAPAENPANVTGVERLAACVAAVRHPLPHRSRAALAQDARNDP